jgi:phospholipid/cholesterol/gamma-HCH transport system substrate-binding protein
MEGEQSSSQGAAPRLWTTVLIISIGLLTLAGLSLKKLSFGPSLRLRTCFQDASGIRSGAKIRLAGVDIGTVGDVRAEPTNKTCPAAVEMEIRTPYELRIPDDSVASTATEGLLGPTYLEIDVSRASGPPIRNGGQLPSKENVKFTAATVDRALRAVELAKRLSDLVNELCDEEKNSSTGSKARTDTNPCPAPSTPSVRK